MTKAEIEYPNDRWVRVINADNNNLAQGFKAMPITEQSWPSVGCVCAYLDWI